jgi:exopolysaccharide biosynthesis polyprenyl glycosylphosphotransferase
MVAAWIRFDSGWIPLVYERPEPLYRIYATGAGVATVSFLLVFRSLGLFVRPQTGYFANKIPRLMKAVSLGVLVTIVLAFAVQNQAEFSRLVIGLSLVTVGFLVVLERYILFRIEWNAARHGGRFNRVLLLGTDATAAHIERTLRREPMLRSRVIGFLRTDDKPPDEGIDAVNILGAIDRLTDLIESGAVDQVILADPGLGHSRIVEIMLLCERRLIAFNMVPDLFRIMTGSMDVQTLDDIPLLGMGRWPLDLFWNRAVKRAEDIAGSAIGLLAAAPFLAVASMIVRRTSPGPAFFRQRRCGEGGKTFTILKIRTMTVDAERRTGPVFASADDPRTTRFGAFLRSRNLDELPQLWNVLKGDMSLVGPRPERPHFVEKFREDVGRYMSRHVSKPGMTGWAQVNGLRGNTSIRERIRYDLYYLENWSLAFDFKILVKTLFARKNAY